MSRASRYTIQGHEVTIPVDRLHTAIRLLVAGFGSSPQEVDAVSTNLIEANLTGHDSHGIGMLPRYTESYLEGGLKPNAHARTLRFADGPDEVHRNAVAKMELGEQTSIADSMRTRKRA